MILHEISTVGLLECKSIMARIDLLDSLTYGGVRGGLNSPYSIASASYKIALSSSDKARDVMFISGNPMSYIKNNPLTRTNYSKGQTMRSR